MEKRTPFLQKIIASLTKDTRDDFSKAEKIVNELVAREKEFISYVTHEFITPLSSIRKISTNLLEDKNLGQVVRQNAAEIQTDVIKLEDLLSGWLKLGTEKSKKILVDLEPIDIINLTDELVGEFEKKHPSRISFNRKKLPKIFADYEKTKVLITHILDNALRFSKGKVGINFKVGSGKLAKNVIISITDKGIGIPEKEKTKIFQSFYKANNHEQKTTGLGLYIARAIAAKQNGQIWLETNQTGTTFFIALPLAK